jgi:hypothetical protein
MFGRHKRFSDRDLGGDIAIDRLLWVEPIDDGRAVWPFLGRPTLVRRTL